VNIHWINCIENIFTVQDFWATCACLEKQSFPWKFSLYWIYFLPFKIFEQLCACPENHSFPWIFHCIKYTFYIPDFWATCACPEFALLNTFFTVTCGEVRDWGGTVSFKAKFASVWIEWSSIHSPLNWLLSEWLLLLLSIPYHNLLHTYRYNGDSRFEKK